MGGGAREPTRIRRLVIVGGGTAGWMAAAALTTFFGRRLEVELVESEAIGIIGVGEATLPHLRFFIEKIGLDEAAFMRATNATYKLGIQFVDWGRLGNSYFHPFGGFGTPLHAIRFHQCWRKFAHDPGVGSLQAFSLPIGMAAAGRFQVPAADARQIESTFGYAYQFDATQFAPLLRKHAIARGARRTEGTVARVSLDGETGDIDALVLSDGRVVEGDFFIDCSGFRGLLIGEALGVRYEDWSRWLPCDRAMAAPSRDDQPPVPYTRATAREAGWQWRIPLQHRTGNGYVYSSAFTDDDSARALLEQHVEGELLAEPRMLRFTPGKRLRTWHRNCVAIGLAGGFLEPLESTSIYLIQRAITDLIDLVPADVADPPERDLYNAQMDHEFLRARDFLILHYHATERDDAALWNYVRGMPIPDSLAERIALFRARGRAEPVTRGVFEEPSWLSVFYGQGIVAERYDQRVDLLPAEQLREELIAMRRKVEAAVAAMPRHIDYLHAAGRAA